MQSARANSREENSSGDLQARLAAIVQSSDDAIISKDLRGIITSWNRGAERIFGYTEQEAVGNSVAMLIPSDRTDEEPGIIARIQAGELVDHYETVRRRKDGSLVEISLSVSPLRDSTGRIVGASKIARDITDRKRAEDERAQAAVRLENALAQRTLELTAANEVLRRSEAMAVLGALAAGIAHDLSNLLLPMRMHLQVLQQYHESAATPHRMHLDALVKAVEYVGELSQRVRQYMNDASRDSLMTPMPTEAVDLARWAKQIEPFLHSIIPSTSGPNPIRLEYRIQPELPLLTVNKTALTQAAYNLVQNSVKAMLSAKRGSVVAIQAWGDEKGGTFLSVEDDGPGMTPQVLARCMEPRFTTDGEGGGTGMGLSLVKAFVDQAAGEVRVYSPLPPNIAPFSVFSRGSGEARRGTAVIMRFPPARPDASIDDVDTRTGFHSESTPADHPSDRGST